MIGHILGRRFIELHGLVELLESERNIAAVQSRGRTCIEPRRQLIRRARHK
jgi:hypothetical protein